MNTDNGNISYLIGSGPFYVDSNNQYSYTATIVDDDDPSIYQASLTSTQLTHSVLLGADLQVLEG